jgi:succinate dehydrogenase/fumarate reductase iron-sulfur protein
MMAETKSIKVKCFRFNPDEDDEPYYVTYEVPLEYGMSLLDVLEYICDNLDSSLAFYGICRRGLCGRCIVSVNGKNRYACQYIPEEDITVEPPPQFEIIRDLFVDFEKLKNP